MNNKHFLIFLVIFGNLLLCFVCIFCAIGITLFNRTDKSEQALINNYNDNKSLFEELVKEIEIYRNDNGNFSLSEYGSITPKDLDTQNLKPILEMMKELDIQSIFVLNDSIDFTVYTFGLSVSGSAKGYYYSSKVPQNYSKDYCGAPIDPVPSIDKYKHCNKGSYTIYQKIDKNFYIYYEYED